MAKQYGKSRKSDNELGQIMRKRMRKLKLSREDLAERMDVNPTYISQLFRYEHQLRYLNMQVLAEALEVSVDRIEKANRAVMRGLV